MPSQGPRLKPGFRLPGFLGFWIGTTASKLRGTMPRLLDRMSLHSSHQRRPNEILFPAEPARNSRTAGFIRTFNGQRTNDKLICMSKLPKTTAPPPQKSLAANDPDVAELESGSPVELVESEIEDATSSPAHYEIVSIPADFTLEGLANKWKKGQLVIPGFQRRFVWTQRQASRLIESFLLGLPVPALFIYTDPDTGAQQVVDGQQRLMSVIQFFDGQFKNASMAQPKLFSLVGLGDGSPFMGCTSKDLEDELPASFAKLNDSVMRAFVIKQLDPSDSTSIYHIFERLNTGGTRLLGQEIRNCVYHGRLNELICELNKNSDWRKIIGKTKTDARMRDVEMILRFVSLYFFATEYKKPMKDFLSTSMRLKRNLSNTEASELKDTFTRTCSIVVNTLGVNPFHGRSGMNPAIFDAIFTAIAKHTGPIPKDLKDRAKQLMASEAFTSKASFRTTDSDAVENRLKLATTQLFSTK